MSWRDKLERIASYRPNHGSIWQQIDLCYDIKEQRHCVVTEVRGQEGDIRYVSFEFAAAFVKEFGEKKNV